MNFWIRNFGLEFHLIFHYKKNKALDQYFPNDSFPNVKFIAEPGRFLCETALTICTRIIAKNTINESLSDKVNGGEEMHQKLSIDKSKSFMYYLNCGFYSGLIEFCELKWGHSISKLGTRFAKHKIQNHLMPKLVGIIKLFCKVETIIG